MTPHTYRLGGFAPRLGWLRWVCQACDREVEQGEDGALVVVTAGESVAHAGAEGRYSVWDAGADLLAPWREV